MTISRTLANRYTAAFALLPFLVVGILFGYRALIDYIDCLRLLEPEQSLDHFGVDYDFTTVGYGYGYGLRLLTPHWTPNGTHIVFATAERFHEGADGKLRPRGVLYVVSADGSGLSRISNSDGKYHIDHSPSVSPDGLSIAYSAYNPVNDDKRYFEIETAELDGSDKRRLTHTAGFDVAPEWSPDGTLIAFHRRFTSQCAHDRSNQGIYVINPDGTDARRIMPTDEIRRVMSMAWSPDGHTLALLVEEEVPETNGSALRPPNPRAAIVSLDAKGSGMNRVFADTEMRIRVETPFVSALEWSPDGSRIRFLSWDGYLLKHYSIGRKGDDLRQTVLLRPDTESWFGSASWSPDGLHLLFTLSARTAADQDISRAVYIAAVDGSSLRKIAEGSYASWSSDGSTIAVVGHEALEEGGATYLYSMGPDGSDRRLLVRIGENGNPELESR